MNIMEAATNVSVPLIAVLLILQTVVVPIVKGQGILRQKSPEGDPSREDKKAAVILSYQVEQIDKRTQSMENAIRELAQATKEAATANRENTKAIERLTRKIEKE